MKWIKTSEQLPPYKKDTKCLVWYKKEITILRWNFYYQSWDTMDGDDHECEDTDVECWMPLPDTPQNESIVEVDGKVVFDFSGDPADIYARRLIVDGDDLNNALIKLNIEDKETNVKLIIKKV